MKRCLKGFILLLSCFASCGEKDKTVSCTKDRTKIPATLSFSGYTADQLDTVVVASYMAENNLSTPFKHDTLRDSGIKIVNGLPYKGSYIYPFASLDAGRGYIVSVPATGQRFTITGIRRSGDSLYQYMSSTGSCNAKGNFYWSPDVATVSGGSFTKVEGNGSANSFLLAR